MTAPNPLRLFGVLLIITSSILVLACGKDKQESKFDKGQWVKFDDSEGGDYPYRDRMLDDLVKNHKLTGLTYRQLIDYLGTPANFDNNDDTVRYEIIHGFESDIDPAYGKNLNLVLGSDSIVTSYKISEWKQN